MPISEQQKLACCHPERVEERLAAMPSERQTAELAEFFRIMGDQTRVSILWALDAGELCVCDLAALLNMTNSAISHQLRALKNARLVKGRRMGKHIYYTLDDEHVRDVFETAVEHLQHQQG